MKLGCAAAFLLSLTGSALLADSGGSFRDVRGRSSVDFAPLAGFIDVCSRDSQLCVMLTEGYPDFPLIRAPAATERSGKRRSRTSAGMGRVQYRRFEIAD